MANKLFNNNNDYRSYNSNNVKTSVFHNSYKLIFLYKSISLILFFLFLNNSIDGHYFIIVINCLSIVR